MTSDTFGPLLLKHVAIGYDVILEETIKIRHVLRAHSGACDLVSALDNLLPMRPIRHNEAVAVVKWIDFIGTEGPKPLELLMEQPSRLVRFDEASRDELKQYRHVPDPSVDGLGIVRVDGTPMLVEPFAPLKKRVRALETFASQILRAHECVNAAEEGFRLYQEVHKSICSICAHYRGFVETVCKFDHSDPPESHTFADLLATETQKEYRGVHLWVGGNATLGGATIGGRYFRVSQRMVGTMTRLDEIGQQPTELTSGSHPTFTTENLPLFFKATEIDNEGSLGTTKERGMFLLANLLFKRGIAESALLTVARHTTVNINSSKRDHPLLKWDIFKPDPDKFQNPAAFDDSRDVYEVVRREQQMFSRLLQVASKIEGRGLLGDVLEKDGLSNLDPTSLSEMVVFTILSTPDDAKGDNFVVDGQGVIIGIDNDHVLDPPCVCATWLLSKQSQKLEGQSKVPQHIVNFKNLLLCHQDVLSTTIHPKVIKLLKSTDIELVLTEWLRQLSGYGAEIERLKEDGALPATDEPWVPTSLGPDDAVARVAKLWKAMRQVIGKKISPTHRDLFEAALPSVASYYHHISELVAAEQLSETRCSKNTVSDHDRAVVDYVYLGKKNLLGHDRVLRWLYYQTAYGTIEPKKRCDAPQAVYLHNVGHHKNQPNIDAQQPEATETEFGSAPSLGIESTLRQHVATQLRHLLDVTDVASVSAFTVRGILESVVATVGESWLQTVPLSWCSHPLLPYKLFQSGSTSTHLLDLSHVDARNAATLTADVRRHGTLPEAVVQTAVEAMIAAGVAEKNQRGDIVNFRETLESDIEDILRKQLKWLKQRGFDVDYYARDSPLTVVSRSFVRVHTQHGLLLCGLNRLFVTLLDLDASCLSRSRPVAQYWAVLQKSTTKNSPCMADPVQTVISTLALFAKRHRKLAWELALAENVVLTTCSTTAHLQCSNEGLSVIPKLNNILGSNRSLRRYNKTGRRLVSFIPGTVGSDLYLKVRPELPGVEFMVRELGRVLFGSDSMPHVELARWLRSDVTGIDRDDPLLISQGVRGRTLFEVLQSSDCDMVLSSLEPQATSQAIILAILTMPEDGKPDNYVCEECEDGNGFRIVCIDNDRSFAAPFIPGKENMVHLNVKSILFCMDQMGDQIHPAVRDVLCSARFDPLVIMKEWLDRLERVNSQGHAIYVESRRTARDLWTRRGEPTAIGVPFPPGVVEELCNKLRRLQSYLGRNAHCTHLDVLGELEPLLEFRYRDTITSKKPLWDRFRDLAGVNCAEMPGVNSTLLDTATMMISKIRQVKTTPRLLERVRSGMECSPAQAKTELEKVAADWAKLSDGTQTLMKGLSQSADMHRLTTLQSIPPTVVEAVLDSADFSQVSTAIQVRFLGMLARKPQQLTRVTLSGFTSLSRSRFLPLVQQSRLTVLKLINCGVFNPNAKGCLVTLSKSCPALEALHFEHADQLDMIADVGWGLGEPGLVKFLSLKILRIAHCSKIRRVMVSFASKRPGRLVAEYCPILKDVELSGCVDWSGCVTKACLGEINSQQKKYCIPTKEPFLSEANVIDDCRQTEKSSSESDDIITKVQSDSLGVNYQDSTAVPFCHNAVFNGELNSGKTFVSTDLVKSPLSLTDAAAVQQIEKKDHSALIETLQEQENVIPGSHCKNLSRTQESPNKNVQTSSGSKAPCTVETQSLLKDKAAHIARLKAKVKKLDRESRKRKAENCDLRLILRNLKAQVADQKIVQFDLLDQCNELDKTLTAEADDYNRTVKEKDMLKAKVANLETLTKSARQDLQASHVDLQAAQKELHEANETLERTRKHLGKIQCETDGLIVNRTMELKHRQRECKQIATLSIDLDDERHREKHLLEIMTAIQQIIVPSPAEARATSYIHLGRAFGVGVSTRAERTAIQQALLSAEFDLPHERPQAINWVSPRRRKRFNKLPHPRKGEPRNSEAK